MHKAVHEMVGARNSHSKDFNDFFGGRRFLLSFTSS